MKVNEKAKELWEQVKNNERYCTEMETWNSGGNMILSEMPIEVDGMDCFMLINRDEDVSIYINRMTDNDEVPFDEEYLYIQFYDDERIPERFKGAAKKLMENRINSRYFDKGAYIIELAERSLKEVHLIDLLGYKENINRPKMADSYLKCPNCGEFFKEAPRCPECGQLIGEAIDELRLNVIEETEDYLYGKSEYYGTNIIINLESKKIYEVAPCHDVCICLIDISQKYDNLDDCGYMIPFYIVNEEGFSGTDSLCENLYEEILKWENDPKRYLLDSLLYISEEEM